MPAFTVTYVRTNRNTRKPVERSVLSFRNDIPLPYHTYEYQAAVMAMARDDAMLEVNMREHKKTYGTPKTHQHTLQSLLNENERYAVRKGGLSCKASLRVAIQKYRVQIDETRFLVGKGPNWYSVLTGEINSLCGFQNPLALPTATPRRRRLA